MRAMASQITGVSIVCSAVCSTADQRKHQRSASLAFVRGIHRWPVDSPHKGPVTRKMFPFDDVIIDWSIVSSQGICYYLFNIWVNLYVSLAKLVWTSSVKESPVSECSLLSGCCIIPLIYLTCELPGTAHYATHTYVLFKHWDLFH